MRGFLGSAGLEQWAGLSWSGRTSEVKGQRWEGVSLWTGRWRDHLPGGMDSAGGEGRLKGVHPTRQDGRLLWRGAACPSPAAPRFPSQVHCISTEFTPRKHGGEKGVPFRVQIDTFKQNENGEYTEHLHSASCQIKVFKVGTASPCPPWSVPAGTPASFDADSDARHSHSATWRPSKEPRLGSCLRPGVLGRGPAPAHPSASSIACVRARLRFIRMSAFAHLEICVFLPRKHLDLPSGKDRDCASISVRLPQSPVHSGHVAVTWRTSALIPAAMGGAAQGWRVCSRAATAGPAARGCGQCCRLGGRQRAGGWVCFLPEWQQPSHTA